MAQKYVIGIGLNLFDARAILLRDDGKIISKIEKDREDISANETIEVLLELFEKIISKTKKYKDKIAGVGIALGGIVNKKKGIVYWPQQQGTSYTYISVPLKDYLEKKFKLPVVIENDANACVLAEYKENFSKYKDVLYMFSGVGCGIMLDGHIYRGKDGAAGELFLYPQGEMKSQMGDFSFLGQWPADLGMVRKAKEFVSRGLETALLKKVTSTGQLELKSIFQCAKADDSVAKEVIKEAALSLGIKISFLINLLNPEIIIVGGGLEEAPQLFLDECINTVKKFSFIEDRRNLNIVFSQLGRRATAMGAALNFSKFF